MNKILVTGGAGYVGSHACKQLKSSGFTPVTFDNLSTGHEEFAKWGPLFIGDLRSESDLRSAFEEHEPVAVIHFAAKAYVGESVIKPEDYYLNNVVGSLNLLRVMREFACEKLIFSSSCATYGIPEITPTPIDHVQAPISPYGQSKLMVEKIISDYCAAYGMSATLLRYFNVAGADLDLEVGERHRPETHLIPNAINAAMQDDGTFDLNGDDYSTADGSCIRDFIHVADLAEAHVLCLQAILQESKNAQPCVAYNLGSGVGYSVLQVIAEIEKQLSTKIRINANPKREGDAPELVADSRVISQQLGWQPKHSDLATIIASAHQWALKELA